MTPLHDAADNGHMSVVEYLVGRKADVEAADAVGQCFVTVVSSTISKEARRDAVTHVHFFSTRPHTTSAHRMASHRCSWLTIRRILYMSGNISLSPPRLWSYPIHPRHRLSLSRSRHSHHRTPRTRYRRRGHHQASSPLALAALAVAVVLWQPL
jgi:negative regulator of sigma E activity